MPLNSAQIEARWRQTLGPEVDLADLSTERSFKLPSSAASTPPTAPEPPPFRLGEELGRGGMGVVYRARQASLDREVALKTLRAPSGQASNAQARAFVAEAVTQGRLEHPNIVPVHDLGFDANGQLQLAMKLIDGEPWKISADHPTERHLEILLQVCNAVALAHSRAVAHCDLKPSNVMLGRFGEVLLTDWGLAVSYAEPPDARLRGRDSVRSPCGTPCYMPPELAEGRGQAIGPWTDVYLLGGLLYQILHGRPPHVGATFLQVVTQAILGRLPALAPDLPEEARSLLQCALAARPEERCSVLEFQQRLRRYVGHRESLEISRGALTRLETCLTRAEQAPQLDARARSDLYTRFSECIAAFGEARRLWPESPEAQSGARSASLAFARCALELGDLNLADTQLGRLADAPEPGTHLEPLREQLDQARRTQQANRSARKRLRRTLIGGGTTIAAVMVLTVVVLSLMVTELRARGDEIAAQNTRLEQGSQQLSEQKRWAERRGQIAEGALNALADKVQGRLIQELGDTHSQQIARELLDVALAGWEELRQARKNEGSRSRGTAFTMLQIALLERVARGDLDAALRAAQEAQQIYLELTQREPHDPEPRVALVQACLHIAEIQRLQGELAAADQTLTSAVPFIPMLAADTVDASIQRIHAQMYKTAAGIQILRGQMEPALTSFGLAIEIGRAAWRRDPTNIDGLRDLVESLANLGDAQSDCADLAAARAAFSEAAQLLGEARLRRPGDRQLRVQTTLLRMKSARLQFEQGDTGGAIVVLESCLENLASILASNPENWHYRQYWASAQTDLGELLSFAGRETEALQLFQSGLEALRTLGRLDPSHVNVARLRSQTARQLGRLLQELGALDEAGELLQESLELSRDLAARDPASFLLRRQLSASYGSLGRWHLHQGQLDSAQVMLQSAYEHDLSLLEKVPDNRRAQHDFSASCLLLAEVLQLAGELDRAQELADDAVALRAAAAHTDPANLYLARSLAVAQERQAQIAHQRGQDTALPGLVAALDGYRRLAEADTGNLRAQIDHLHVGMTLAEWLAPEAPEQARARVETCVARYRALREQHPDNPAVLDYLADACRSLAGLVLQTRELQTAADLLEEARGMQRQLVTRNPSDMALQDQLARICHKLGSVLLVLQHFEEADAAAREALATRVAMFEAMDGHPQIGFRLARTAGLAGQTALAVRDLDAAAQTLQLGLQHVDQLDPQAHEGARGALGRLLLLLGDLYAAQEEYADAEQVYAVVESFGLGPVLLGERRGDLAWRRGDLAGARMEYARASEAGAPLLRVRSGLAALAEGQREAALEDLQSARDSGSAEAVLWLAALGDEPAELESVAENDSWAAERARWLLGRNSLDALLESAVSPASAALGDSRTCQALALQGVRAWAGGDAEEARTAFLRCSQLPSRERYEQWLARQLLEGMAE